MPRQFLAIALVLGACLALSPARGEVTATKNDLGVTIEVDGAAFATYLTRSGSKPVIWPIYGPSGKRITRNWPLENGVPGETDRDHVHQRSLWFTHGDVNGVDFWSEGKGRIEHREFVRIESGLEAVVITRNEWQSPDGKPQLSDERTHRFGAAADRRWIDFDVALTASHGPVRFGDTKEGSFGVRVASTMRVDSKQGGRIVNSEGQANAAAWGQQAAWVDYHGPVEGELLGIAVMNHPQSFRFPTYWHVRTYGLFAANPFGWSDFTAGAKQGEYTLPAGESIRLRYRVLLHSGDEKAGHVAEAYAEFAR